MDNDQLNAILARALEGRRLLEHPFYQRWEAGELSKDELARYASQYAHVERQLPTTLAAIEASLPDGEARQLVSANLADELGNPEPHVKLFADFMVGVGASEAPATPATPATQRLVDLYRRAGEGDPMPALGVLAAYEVQAGQIAASKADGLRRHYGLGVEETRFWDVHAALESTHASWTTSALAAADATTVAEAARASADAWWAFLDERETEAA